MNPEDVSKRSKVIAIVGLSDKPERPSYAVGRYLLDQGMTVIPVNPKVTTVFGRRSYPTVSAIPPEIPVDIVDVFRKPDQVIPVIDDVLNSGRKPILWLQEGVGSKESETYAQIHGLDVVANVCLMKTHRSANTENPT